MKVFKKMLTILLALCLILPTAAVGVSADDAGAETKFNYLFQHPFYTYLDRQDAYVVPVGETIRLYFHYDWQDFPEETEIRDTEYSADLLEVTFVDDYVQPDPYYPEKRETYFEVRGLSIGEGTISFVAGGTPVSVPVSVRNPDDCASITYVIPDDVDAYFSDPVTGEPLPEKELVAWYPLNARFINRPWVTANDDHLYDGGDWYLDPSDESTSLDFIADGNKTYYIKLKECVLFIQDPNGSSWGQDTISKEKVVKGSNRLYSYRLTPTRKHYNFTGWYYDAEATELFAEEVTDPLPFPLYEDLKVYAGWEKIEGDEWEVTLDGNGEKFESGETKLVVQVPKEDPLYYSGIAEIIFNEERDAISVLFSTDPDGTDCHYYTDYWVPSSETTIYAQWAYLATSIEVKNPKNRLSIGESYRLNSEVLPQRASFRSVEYYSSNEDVATIDESGYIEAVGVGTTTITVKSMNSYVEGVSTSFELSVVSPEEEEWSLELDPKETSIYVGDSATLQATITPEDDDAEITWVSSNNEVATVDQNGKVTGKKAGSAVITAKRSSAELDEEYRIAEEAYNDAVEDTESKTAIAQTKNQEKENKVTQYESAKEATREAVENLEELNTEKSDKIAEKETEESALATVQQEKADAERELREAESAYDNAETNVENATNALKAAEEKIAEADALVSKGTKGFFENNGSTKAVEVLEFGTKLENLTLGNGKEEGITEIGDEGDATSLENMRNAFAMIREGNALRAADAYRHEQEGYSSHPNGTSDGLPDELLVSDVAMAAAQVNANMEVYSGTHWTMDGSLVLNKKLGLYFGENLAANWYAGWDPYYGWFTDERELYIRQRIEAGKLTYTDKANDLVGYANVYPSVTTGHYTNLINPDDEDWLNYRVTGYGLATKNGKKTHVQTFTWDGYGGTAYTIDEYEAMFDEYCEEALTKKEEGEAEKAAADALLEEYERNGGISDAEKERIESAQDAYDAAADAETDSLNELARIQAEINELIEAISEAEETKEAAKAAEEDSRIESEDAEQAYNVAEQARAAAEQNEENARQRLDAVSEKLGKLTDTCRVTVKDIAVTGVTLNKASLTLESGKAETLTATVSPNEATNKKVTWSSNNTSVASVDSSGKVTAKSAGTATITVKTANGGKTATCNVTVKDPASSSTPGSTTTPGATEEKTEAEQAKEDLGKTDVTPMSEDKVNSIPTDKSIPKINASKISTSANTTKKQMTVKFPAVKGATNYLIAYKTASAKDWTYTTTGKKTSYAIKKMKAGGLYQFKVAAVKNGKKGTWSKISYRYYKVAAKCKVKAGAGKMTVSWTKNTKATQYQIMYSTNKNMKGAKKVTIKGGARTKYTIKGLTKGKTYYVRVRPIRKSGGKNYIGILTGKRKVKIK